VFDGASSHWATEVKSFLANGESAKSAHCRVRGSDALTFLGVSPLRHQYVRQLLTIAKSQDSLQQRRQPKLDGKELLLLGSSGF